MFKKGETTAHKKRLRTRTPSKTRGGSSIPEGQAGFSFTCSIRRVNVIIYETLLSLTVNATKQ